MRNLIQAGTLDAQISKFMKTIMNTNQSYTLIDYVSYAANGQLRTMVSTNYSNNKTIIDNAINNINGLTIASPSVDPLSLEVIDKDVLETEIKGITSGEIAGLNSRQNAWISSIE